MSATNGQLVAQVRQVLEDARQAGQRPPGRPTLVKKTGASDHQVRRALAEAAAHSPAAGGPLVDAGEDVTATGDPGVTRPPAGANGTGEPVSPAHHQPARPPRPWPLWLIGLAGIVSVWSGWVGLAQMAGFGVIQPLPGIWDDLRINTAVVLPVSAEAYAFYAVRVWLSTETSARTTRFARRSTYASLGVGAGAQVTYHLLAAAGFTRAPWPVVMAVSVVPVVMIWLASALAKLVANDAKAFSPGGQIAPAPTANARGVDQEQPPQLAVAK